MLMQPSIRHLDTPWQPEALAEELRLGDIPAVPPDRITYVDG
jgi:hypothetical protein